MPETWVHVNSLGLLSTPTNSDFQLPKCSIHPQIASIIFNATILVSMEMIHSSVTRVTDL